jgi:hypothetical protein
MNTKNIGGILIGMAIIMFTGVITNWSFEIWIVVDWIFIIVLVILGYILLENNNKNV